MNFTDEQLESLMQNALKEVEKSIEGNNPPFAALLINNVGEVVNLAHNTVATDRNHLFHAEIKLLLDSRERLGIENFSDYAVVCNAASCAMCTTAMLKCQIKNYYFGASSPEVQNPNVSMEQVIEQTSAEVQSIGCILQDECQEQIDRGLSRVVRWW